MHNYYDDEYIHKSNHRTKKKRTKGSSPKTHEFLDGKALLKELKKENPKRK